MQRISGNDLFVTKVENTQRFMNEAFEMSSGTQRSDMGLKNRALVL